MVGSVGGQSGSPNPDHNASRQTHRWDPPGLFRADGPGEYYGDVSRIVQGVRRVRWQDMVEEPQSSGQRIRRLFWITLMRGGAESVG